MRLIFLVLFIFMSFQNVSLQGKWKLTRFEAFSKTLASTNFLNETKEKQELMLETFDFVLANTFYEFIGDSVYFTNAGGGGVVIDKSGKWLIKKDTLFIFESGKFKTHKFWIEKLSEDELELKGFIPGPSGMEKGSSMIFTKLP